MNPCVSPDAQSPLRGLGERLICHRLRPATSGFAQLLLRTDTSLPPRHSICNVAALDISAWLAREKVKERELDGAHDIFWCFEIARKIDVRLVLLQVLCLRSKGWGKLRHGGETYAG